MAARLVILLVPHNVFLFTDWGGGHNRIRLYNVGRVTGGVCLSSAGGELCGCAVINKRLYFFLSHTHAAL